MVLRGGIIPCIVGKRPGCTINSRFTKTRLCMVPKTTTSYLNMLRGNIYRGICIIQRAEILMHTAVVPFDCLHSRYKTRSTVYCIVPIMRCCGASVWSKQIAPVTCEWARTKRQLPLPPSRLVSLSPLSPLRCVLLKYCVPMHPIPAGRCETRAVATDLRQVRGVGQGGGGQLYYGETKCSMIGQILCSSRYYHTWHDMSQHVVMRRQQYGSTANVCIFLSQHIEWAIPYCMIHRIALSEVW